MSFINPNIKVLALPLFAIPVVIILSVIVADGGYSRVSKQLRDLSTIKKDQEVLENKLEVLKNIRDNVLEQTEVSVIALPQKNPATQEVSLVKKYSQEQSLTIAEIKLESGVVIDEVFSSTLETKLTSSEGLTPTLSYIKALINSLPLASVSEVTFEKDIKGEIAFKTKDSVYWAKFPTKLPALQEPIKELTANEKELLEDISNMQKPDFTVLEPGQSYPDRQNPFF